MVLLKKQTEELTGCGCADWLCCYPRVDHSLQLEAIDFLECNFESMHWSMPKEVSQSASNLIAEEQHENSFNNQDKVWKAGFIKC